LLTCYWLPQQQEPQLQHRWWRWEPLHWRLLASWLPLLLALQLPLVLLQESV
jgi:hypothetical protein